ncbi:uncharacterized protein LOC121384577 [Gigantopelta aegis]|uniref:uncharacterized protein LOC121384577 n=1 Tax=Gigantopelta aegis TaxID=1735272 RepID=UPI001B889C55|nr:uncharacterized protein LOC121384577 [Gigantopelta aegis]
MGVLAVFVALLACSHAYRDFQLQLPNGDNVPHPCKKNFVWKGLGHLNALGGGSLNPFGEDFKRASKKWTTALCEKDSDGDGLTNGQELGDPECVWAPNDFPSRLKNITHPGICTPWDDDKCRGKNDWVNCEATEFECDAVKEPDVQNVTLRFPKTRIPAKETTYACMTFDLPQDGDYHVIATKPFIDNVDVIHHMLLYECMDGVPATSSPEHCYMANTQCRYVMGIWAVGFPGECLYKEQGFRIGTNGTKTAVLQIHWTNPNKRDDFTDSSGITLFYTANRRKYDAVTIFVGQRWLEIPPGEPRVTEVGTCTGECTRRILKGPVYVTRGINHMHYLGIEQKVELFRGDKKIKVLTDDPLYSYDSPVVHEYEEPVEIQLGDHLKTTCVFRSLSKNKTTYWGFGSYEEMCFGLLTVYPKHNIINDCVSWKNISFCDFTNMYSACTNNSIAGSTDYAVAIRKKVLDNCNVFGGCRSECPAVLADVRKEPCLAGELGEYSLMEMSRSRNMDLMKFAFAMRSCDCPRDQSFEHVVPNSGATFRALVFSVLSLAAFVLVIQ